MRKFFQTKRMMSFVCVLFTAILSLCSINIINYQDLLTTSSQEEVYGDNTNTSNENDNNTINNEENNSQNDKNETNNNGTTENTNNTTGTGEEDDLDDVVGARDTWDNHASTSLSGSGTSSDPYKIGSAVDLAYLAREDANKSAYYELTNNIDLSRYDWMPIQDFEGNFKGNGYTISNMTINNNCITGERNSYDYIGLFGKIKTSRLTIISDFFLTGSINLYIGATLGGAMVGTVVGSICTDGESAASVMNIASFVDINYDFQSGILGDGFVGGIIGETEDNSDSSINIASCTYAGEIVINKISRNRGNLVCGGIVAYAGNDSSKLFISNCANYGSISCDNDKYSADYTGGILGYANPISTSDPMTIEYCVNYGSINSSGGDGYYVGGIVGALGSWTLFNKPTGHINYCINYGSVSTNRNCDFVGQIAGYLDSEYDTIACKNPAKMFGKKNDSKGHWISMAYSDLDDVKDFMENYFDSAYYEDKSIYNAWTGVSFESNNSITNDYATIGNFIASIYVAVAVRNENDEFTIVENKSAQYRVGYSSNITTYNPVNSLGDVDKTENIHYMFKSTSEYEIISSIYNNSKDKYEYLGLSTSINEKDIFADETKYSENTYNLPYYIYVLFDLVGEEEPEPIPPEEEEPEVPEYTVNFKVYYTERIGFNGKVPADLILDTYREGGYASISFNNSNTKNETHEGSLTFPQIKYQTPISITAYPKEEFEICGVYAGDVSENPNECVNLLDLAISGTYGTYDVNIFTPMSSPTNLGLNQITYSFKNEIRDEDGYLITDYSIVFSRYQYTGISFTQSFETDRFDEPYEVEIKREFMYGYLNRSLGGFNKIQDVDWDRGNEAPKFYEVNEAGGYYPTAYDSNNPYQLQYRDDELDFNYFDTISSYYVGKLLTPTWLINGTTSPTNLDFYWLWGANDKQKENEFYFRRYRNNQFDENEKIIEGRGLTAVADKANNYPPYFTINLYYYFMWGNAFDDYGNFSPTSWYLSGPEFNYIDFRTTNGESAFMAGGVSFKEYTQPSGVQNFNLYFLNMYEDMASVETFFGDEGGKFEVSSLGGLDVEKTNFKLEDGKIVPMDSETGTDVEGYAVLNIGLRFTYRFVYSIDEPFKSYYDTKSDDVILNEEDEKLIMETPITSLFKFIKSPNYLYHDFFGDRNTLFNDFGTYAGIDLSEYTIYDLAMFMNDYPEDSAVYENILNGNILLYNYFEVNRYRGEVVLNGVDDVDIKSILSFYANGVKYQNQYGFERIKAYSDIKIVIDEPMFFVSDGINYYGYAYKNITMDGKVMTNQDSWHFQIIPENNGRNVIFNVNFDKVFSMSISDFSSLSIEKVGNMWYIDEARDFYYLYYLNAFAGEDFEGIRLIQTANIDFGGDLIMPLGTSSTPFRGV